MSRPTWWPAATAAAGAAPPSTWSPRCAACTRHAEDDGLITPDQNPARKVDKPRRLPSTRRAVTDDRLAEICQAAADGGDDPELDTLLLRLHTETACFPAAGRWRCGLMTWTPASA
jgi:hypothetical protein